MAFSWVLMRLIPLVLNELEQSTKTLLSLYTGIGLEGSRIWRSDKTWWYIWAYMTRPLVVFTSASHELWLIQFSLWVFQRMGHPPLKEMWPQMGLDLLIETGQLLVGQKLLRVLKVLAGRQWLPSETGIWMYDSRDELGDIVKCRPNEYIDPRILPHECVQD